jgi:tRNA A-37 threonylcarbamoyl transferase component Bud32
MDSEDRQVAHIGASDVDLREGDAVGDYVVAGKIGEGGFGSVYRAEHPLIGKQVAIKVLNRQYSADPSMVQRFVAEARAVNQIRHRNIIDIFGFGQLPDGRHYYVMEFLEGSPLDQYVTDRGRVSLADAIPILRSVARALDAAHGKGIAHRDLKPENVYLAFEEGGGLHPKLLDFGIAKLLTKEEGSAPSFKTRTGAPIGTPYYMSPEQCRGRDVDHRTDIYAFGCVTYRMLTGVYPFDGPDYMEILIKQINEEPHPPSHLVAELPMAIDQVVSWMLKKNPAERPPNLLTAVRALEEAAVAAGVAVPAEASASGMHGSSSARFPSTPTPSPAAVTPVRTPANKLQTADTMPAGPVTVPEPRGGGGKKVLVGLLALAVVGAGGFVAYSQLGAKSETSPPPPASRAAAEPVRPETPPVAVPAAGTEPVAPPAVDRFVELAITGTPEGTEVLGPTGPIGAAPGTVQLPRGDDTLLLTFRAPGHKPATREVIPREDGVLEVPLEPVEAPGGKKKRRGKKAGGDAPADTNSIEDPF